MLKIDQEYNLGHIHYNNVYAWNFKKGNKRQGGNLSFMEIIIYGVIFIIGTLFGSFFTLAVYRIPLGLDITHEHFVQIVIPNLNSGT